MVTGLKNLASLFLAFTFFSCNGETEFHNANKKPKPKADDIEVAGFVKNFATSNRVSSNIAKSGEEEEVSVEYRLTHDTPRQMSFLQSTRPTINKEYKQGHDGTSHAESFPLVQDGALDILIVVDNSHSMEVYQERLAERFEPLLQHITHTDWQIAVVTTDRYCRQNFGQVLDRESYNEDPAKLNQDFKKAIEAGTTGHPIERGIEMAIRGARGDCGGEWMRPSSKKAVLLISDEENCGSAPNEGPDKGCPGQPNGFDYYGPQDFVSELGANTKFYGILYDMNQCTDNFYDVQPQDYYDLVQDTGGFWGLICQEDYTQLLTEISRDVGQETVRDFELEVAPHQSSLVIKIDNQPVANSYIINDHKVTVMGDFPQGAKEISFTYQSDVVQKFDRLVVENKADMNTLKVSLNGQEMSEASYSLEFKDGTQFIVFHEMPAEDADVVVSYRENSVLENTFFIMSEVEPSSVSIMLENSPVSNSDFWYNTAEDKVVFMEAPTDGERFDVTFNLASDYVTQYPIPETISDFVESFELTDNEGAPIEATIEGDFLTVPPREISDGKIVNASFAVYKLEIGEKVLLPFTPVPDSVEVRIEGCNKKPKSIKGKEIELDCKEEYSNNFSINYSYYTEIQNRFVVGTVPQSATLEVFLDEEPFHQFTYENGEVIIAKEHLTVETSVKVIAKFELDIR